MNDFLNLKEKDELIEKLRRHYTYPPKVSTLINALSDTTETRLNMQLKAFAVVGEEIKHDYSNTVLIDELSSRLQLVKAVKDVIKCGLKEAKDLVETIVPLGPTSKIGVCAYDFKPFKVGPKERITVDQWKAIVSSIPHGNFIKWHFV